LMCVSHQWQSAVLTMKPIGAHVALRTSREVAESRLRRHVAHVSDLECDVSSLRHLAQQLPHLHFLQLSKLSPDGTEAEVEWQLPPQLRSLGIQTVKGSPAQKNSLIRHIAQLQQLTSLHLGMWLVDASLQPLIGMPQL